MKHAREEAVRLNHDYIGTEHILLGLLHDSQSLATRSLRNLGVDLDRVRRDVDFIVARGPTPVSGQLPYTPRAKRVLELSAEEAGALGQKNIGAEHLLLGLVREGVGIAAEVLRNQGATTETVRVSLSAILDGDP